jgi:hypothetical protein
MFHALMGRFQLFYLFFHRRSTRRLCFLSCRPLIVNATFSTGLVVSSVSWLGLGKRQKKFRNPTIEMISDLNSVNCSSQETEETTKPVENVALTMKDLQERKHNL